ncbi:MAG: hypothetical protein ABI649_03740 [Gaiellaceae bacterium]
MRNDFREPLAAWTGGDWLLAGGIVLALLGLGEEAWTIKGRFDPAVLGLGAPERAAVALWELRPLVFVPFVLGALLVLAALLEPPGRLGEARERARPVLTVLAAAHAVFALVVVGLAGWVAAAGSIAGRDEITFFYSGSHRALTLATQALAYVPLAALLAAVAMRASFEPVPVEKAEPPARSPGLLAEMEELWSERLAFGPRREQARRLLERLRALEGSGDVEGAQQVADQLRRL